MLVSAAQSVHMIGLNYAQVVLWPQAGAEQQPGKGYFCFPPGSLYHTPQDQVLEASATEPQIAKRVELPPERSLLHGYTTGRQREELRIPI